MHRFIMRKETPTWYLYWYYQDLSLDSKFGTITTSLIRLLNRQVVTHGARIRIDHLISEINVFPRSKDLR
jgi:hypothetical protein